MHLYKLPMTSNFEWKYKHVHTSFDSWCYTMNLILCIKLALISYYGLTFIAMTLACSTNGKGEYLNYYFDWHIWLSVCLSACLFASWSNPLKLCSQSTVVSCHMYTLTKEVMVKSVWISLPKSDPIFWLTWAFTKFWAQ